MVSNESTTTFQVLDQALCHESAPFRIDVMGQEGFLQIVAAMATRSKSAKPPGFRKLLHHFRRNELQLAKACRRLTQLSLAERTLPAASEWLLDNHYIINTVIDEIKQDLPVGFYRELPALQSGHFRGYPRIYQLGVAVLAHSDSNLNVAFLQDVVNAYQEVAPFSIGELWALPTMLRLGLLENLRRLANRIIGQVNDQHQAKTAIQTLLSGLSPRLPARPSATYTLALWEGLKESDLPVAKQGVRLTHWIDTHFKNMHEVQHAEYCQQAADQVTIGNAITSLRLLGVVDWANFFETHSIVEKLFRSDPNYAQQDFVTRDSCRRALEEMARGSRHSEFAVAQAAIAEAQTNSLDQLKSHISYWLLDDGRPALRQQLDVRLNSRHWFRQWVLKNANVVFFGLLTSLILVGVGLLLAVSSMTSLPYAWLLVLITLIPLSEMSVSLVNRIIGWLLSPRLLPRYEWKTGIPVEHSTLVVIPALVCKPQTATHLLERLEQHYLANPDPQLWFALLTDFHDADQQQKPGDQDVVNALLQGVSDLNHRHHYTEQPRFFVLHRHRVFNASENCWMGWERKRGKLEELNRLLRGKNDTSYSVQSAPLSELPRIAYVLTLDADTVLPSDTARQMIARLAHPLNRARLSADGRRVERGYGILQPRVSFLYDTGLRSLFARWFAGSSGIDPYSSATSDTYMDLFGTATFTGKGLYDVDAFAATAGHAFPDNHILSHDLIESNYARCGLASDIQVFDEFPSKYLTYACRDHRWIRGDWQLLPWLATKVPTPLGMSNTVLGTIERWKILDNFRRSLVSIASLLLLILAWCIPNAPRVSLTVLAVLPFLLPSLLELLSIINQFMKQRHLSPTFRRLRSEWMNTLSQAMLQLVFLPYHAGVCLDAIVRTLYRVFISKKHLLEWESAATVEHRMSNTPMQAVRTFWLVELFTIALTIGLAIWMPVGLLWASPFLLGWLLSPFVAYFVSAPITVQEVVLTAEEQKYLEGIVQKTWLFFERFVGEEDHWLPPDNYQENPCDSVAHRTSPTNIGAYLLCVLAAHAFKLITPSQVIHRLQKTFDTLEGLGSHRGHLLNWYDTRTLHTLHPEYVSTVDSGNLLACLLALKHGLISLAEEPGCDESTSQELKVLAARAERLAARMDFRFLYNQERDLFAIGYNADTQRLDNNHYDLLASEACIASFLTIALGQAPRQHWSKLGRLFTHTAGHTGLISWGGTMFEYLMPRLLLPVSPGILLDRIQHSAVLRQIEYGKELGLPWGMSESAYYAFDGSKQYQYQSFGVPGLGLKRGLSRDRVLAPYATLLAVDVMPREAIANLKRLSREGGEGKYGFYEAIDYTTSRLPADTKKCVIQTYMAHHQGMGLLAITNCLKQGLIRNWLRAEPAVRSAGLLLQERLPYDVPVMQADSQEIDSTTASKDLVLSRRRIVTAATPVPRTHLMSNGRYSVMVTNAGSGFSRFQDIDVTRWRSDPTSDCSGQFVYVRNRREATLWSLGHQPICKTADEFEVIFSLDKADFHRVDNEIDSLMEVTVVPDADVEIRRITLTNLGRRSKHLDLTSYAEVVLQSSAADQAHPAFGKLFLETEWLPQHAALLCRRRPRSPEQAPLFAVHILADDGRSGTVSFETDRAQFLGRRRQVHNPAAMDSECRLLSGRAGAVLDPIFSIRRSLKIRSGEKAELAFITGYADSREAAIALADRYHALSAVHRGFELAYAHTHIEMQHAHLQADDVHLFQRLAGYLHYPAAGMRAPQEVLAANRLGQAGLWSYSLSGDLPICLLRLHSTMGLKHLNQFLKAHQFWSSKGLRVDLVVLCENAGGYYDETYTQAINQIRSTGLGDKLDRHAGIMVRKGGQISEADRMLLLTCASTVIDDRAGPLNLQGTQLPNTLPPPPMTRKLPSRNQSCVLPRRIVWVSFTMAMAGFQRISSNTSFSPIRARPYRHSPGPTSLLTPMVAFW